MSLAERVRALADELEAEFDAYRLEDPVHLRVRALLTPGEAVVRAAPSDATRD